MHTVAVNEERETDRGWSFDVAFARGSGELRQLSVTLSWVDYDNVCGGSAAPAAVVNAIINELAERGLLESYPDSFDASRAMRRVDGLCDAVRGRL